MPWSGALVAVAVGLAVRVAVTFGVAVGALVGELEAVAEGGVLVGPLVVAAAAGLNACVCAAETGEPPAAITSASSQPAAISSKRARWTRVRCSLPGRRRPGMSDPSS